MKNCIALFFFVVLSISLNAQAFVTEHIMHDTSFQINTHYQVEDMAWIKGNWAGEGLGGYCEEIWSSPVGGIMSGIFRFYKDDKLVFSEFLSLQHSGDGIGLLVKHFTPEFHAWEEKEDFINFELIKIEDKLAYFQGLTIDGRDEGMLKIYVLMKNKEGNRWEEPFVFKKN
jgi:hypothetical protein